MSNPVSVLQPPNNFAPVHILVNDIGIHIISYDTKVSSQELLEGVYYFDILICFDAGKNNKFTERLHSSVDMVLLGTVTKKFVCKNVKQDADSGPVKRLNDAVH